jgi:hypothetical protein
MKPHECQGVRTPVNRMLLALFDNHSEALDEVVTEIGDCERCWKNVALHCLSMVASNWSLAEGSLDAAADTMRKTMKRELMQ